MAENKTQPTSQSVTTFLNTVADKGRREDCFSLLDMKRYHLLLAGASWMAEYGDPDDPDTYAEPDRFYSYRRSTHRGEADYGRQLSMIGVAP